MCTALQRIFSNWISRVRRKCIYERPPANTANKTILLSIVTVGYVNLLHSPTQPYRASRRFFYRYRHPIRQLLDSVIVFLAPNSPVICSRAPLYTKPNTSTNTHTHTRFAQCDTRLWQFMCVFCHFFLFQFQQLGKFHNCAIAGITVSHSISRDEA